MTRKSRHPVTKVAVSPTPAYSPQVQRLVDPRRPKYSEAVKAFAALARTELALSTMVIHLNAACQEAVAQVKKRK